MIGLIDLLFSSSPFQLGYLDQSDSLALQIAASIFALVLFFVTLYSWSRRRKEWGLLLVAFAFLGFFSNIVIEILPVSELHDELISAIMDFVILGLFFLVLVAKPRRSVAKASSNKV